MKENSGKTGLLSLPILLLVLLQALHCCGFLVSSSRNSNILHSIPSITVQPLASALGTAQKKDDEYSVDDDDDDDDDDRAGVTMETSQVRLASGIVAQVIRASPTTTTTATSTTGPNLPPLLFVHGSLHAAWCWAERYLPYFASLGYEASALSLRGTGGTDAGEGITKVKIEDHVHDLSAFLDLSRHRRPPVLIAHSFGGMVVLKYLEGTYTDTQHDNKTGPLPPTLSGVALLCSVPPSGNGKMTLRFLQRSLRDSWKITAGLALKKCLTDADLCRTLFFDGGTTTDDRALSDEDVARFQSYFQRDSVATVDLRDLAGKLPSASADRESGTARWWSSAPLPLPVLVLGASDDFIVDREGVTETATYLGVSSPIIVDSPHDVMLGPKWKNGADALLHWIEEEVASSSL